ncbi:MAG TPA: hypothetical protein VGG45_10790 [Terracidiphilus sp.]|jgi:hypothetical protein
MAQPITFDAPLKQPTTVPVPAGVTFDDPLTSATSVPVGSDSQTQPTNPAAQALSQAGAHADPALGDVAGAVAHKVFPAATGAAKSVMSTLSGTDEFARKHLPAVLTNSDFGFGPPADLDKEKQNLTPEGTGENIGSGLEDLGEFLLGDEALKGLSLSERLGKVSKIIKTTEESPVLSRIVQAGLRAVRGAAVGSAQGGLKSGGNLSVTAGAGIAAGVGNAVLPEAFDAVKSIPHVAGVISDAVRGAERVVQPELQNSLRKILSDVGAENGITIPDGTAVRDIAEHLGHALKSKGSALYKSIDNALGGTRFQTFDEQLSNVRNALRNDTGIDHDYTGRLIERVNDLEDAKAAARQTAIGKGIDPRDFQQADNFWRQGSAIQDLSSKIRQSTSGLPDNLKNGTKAASAANGEVVSPNKLSPKIHSLRDSGRLSQAIGPNRSDELLRQVESARARTADIANNQKTIRKVAVGSAAAAGAAGAGYGGYEVARHALQ